MKFKAQIKNIAYLLSLAFVAFVGFADAQMSSGRGEKVCITTRDHNNQFVSYRCTDVPSQPSGKPMIGGEGLPFDERIRIGLSGGQKPQRSPPQQPSRALELKNAIPQFDPSVIHILSQKASQPPPPSNFRVESCMTGLCPCLASACFGISSGGTNSPQASFELSPWVTSNNPQLNMALTAAMYKGRLEPIRETLGGIPKPLSDKELETYAYNLFRKAFIPLNPLSEPVIFTTPEPVPAGVSSQFVASLMDPIWETREADPFAAVDNLNMALVMAQTRYHQGDSKTAEYVFRELYRNFTNTDGVIRGLPFAEYEGNLISSPFSERGLEVRIQLNSVLVSESVLKMKCAIAKADCQAAEGLIELVKFNLTLADRMTLGYQQNHFSKLMNVTNQSVDLLRGVAQGVWEGSLALADGIKQLVTHPVDAIVGLATAIVNYEETFAVLSRVLEGQWQTLLNGTAEERGNVIGRAAFEVAAVLLPVSKVSTMQTLVAKGGVVSRGIEMVAQAKHFVPEKVWLAATNMADTSALNLKLRYEAQLKIATRVEMVEAITDLQLNQKLAAPTIERVLESAEKLGLKAKEEIKGFSELTTAMTKYEGPNPANIANHEKFKASLAVEEIQGAKVIGSALKEDAYHRSASYMLDAAKEGKMFTLRGSDGTKYNLLQVEGKLNAQAGIYEWLTNLKGELVHQRFIKDGRITGIPNFRN